MGVEDIRLYLSHLAIEKRIAASTQSIALCALLLLYRQVLRLELPYVGNIERAQKPRRVPVVFTREEVRSILSHLEGETYVMASLLYGSGLRLTECLQLRVKDLDFEYRQITVRDGKGEEDRPTLLPEMLVELLKVQLEQAKLIHQQDLAQGYGAVYLPYALERKYPHANRDWKWQYVFSAAKRSIDPRTGVVRRHHY